MAYEVEEIEAEALKAIKENDITFFDDICLYVEPSRATLYNLELDKLDTIKEALRKNKLKIKAKMRKNWQQHDSPVLQVAAYKLLAEDEELKKLTMNKFEHSGENGKPIENNHQHTVIFKKMNGGDSTNL
jgi:hypothetical protein